MLSLPADWDYTLKGLTFICKDGKDAVNTALHELEKEGYLKRNRLRSSSGQFGTIEYTIYEQPPKTDPRPDSPDPKPVFPNQASPILGNQPQLNKDKQNKEIKKEKREQIDAQVMRVDDYREWIKDNIDYEILVELYGKDRLDTIIELMLEVVVSDNPYCLIAKERLPREVVRSRMLKLNSEHIEYVFDQLNKTTSKVGNAKAYVLAALFNAPVNMDTQIQFEVNRDFPL